MGTSSKSARATKKDLEEREAIVLGLLEERHLSAPELADELNLSYPQMLLILTRLETCKKIERIPGRIDRKILYRISGPYSREEALIIDTVPIDTTSEFRAVIVNSIPYVSVEDVCSFLVNAEPEFASDEFQSYMKTGLPVKYWNGYVEYLDEEE